MYAHLPPLSHNRTVCDSIAPAVDATEDGNANASAAKRAKGRREQQVSAGFFDGGWG
jgi:hypothetical protein